LLPNGKQILPNGNKKKESAGAQRN